MKEKVQKLLKKFQEVEQSLGDPGIHLDQKKFKELTRQHSYLLDIKDNFEKLQTLEKQLQDNKELLDMEDDPEMLDIAMEEKEQLEEDIKELSSALQNLLVPPDPRDSRNILIEIRAGAGGDEAALFVGDLIRMYKYFADKQGWKYEKLSSTPSDAGGFKEYIMVLSGKNVFRFMQYEAGTHRVQRVPETETQGRVHTSAVTVAVLLEPTEEDKVEIDEKDLKIDTYRASGAGGQHVNVTDSAVRITHLPTGTVVTCQDERSQHKNKDKCMRLLGAKIAEEIRKKQEKEISSLRASQVGSGERSEKIRTYNFPQNRVSDHRINLTLYKLDLVMQGDLEEFVKALVAYNYQKKLEEA